ncbi:MAG: hypothetical protein L0Z07_02145, partial [Planctomycetes bacterium]|nr:hypothetical protein [Planctomycetota bacterium]
MIWDDHAGRITQTNLAPNCGAYCGENPAMRKDHYFPIFKAIIVKSAFDIRPADRYPLPPLWREQSRIAGADRPAVPPALCQAEKPD